MYWILSYVLPATIGGITRNFLKTELQKGIYIHLVLLLSIFISWNFIESFTWGISNIGIIIFILTTLFSIILLKHPLYVLSAAIQELCILSAFFIAPLWSIPVLLFYFSVLHPTMFVKIGTIFLGSASIFLFASFDSVVWSICLHIFFGTLLFYFRNKGIKL